MDHIAGLEQQANKIALEWFKSEELTKATEFHGKALYFGKYPCKGSDPDQRLKILMSLVDLVAQLTFGLDHSMGADHSRQDSHR